jgi:hypothetical protein
LVLLNIRWVLYTFRTILLLSYPIRIRTFRIILLLTQPLLQFFGDFRTAKLHEQQRQGIFLVTA